MELILPFQNYPYSPIECIDKVLKEMGTLQVLSIQWNLACIFGTLLYLTASIISLGYKKRCFLSFSTHVCWFLTAEMKSTGPTFGGLKKKQEVSSSILKVSYLLSVCSNLTANNTTNSFNNPSKHALIYCP